MRAKDIVNKYNLTDEGDSCCMICEIHSKAEDAIDTEIYCPLCDAELCYVDEHIIVGENNAPDLEQKIGRYPHFMCDKCQQEGRVDNFALMPIPIMYNANHDIYYTGGKDYIIDTSKMDSLIQEKICPLIEQYTSRIKGGEQLESWNLSTWISHEIEHIIATILYENGMKK